MTAPDPPPAALRAVLKQIIHTAGAYCGDCDYDDESCGGCCQVLGTYADAILSDPRIKVTLAGTDVPQPDLRHLAAWEGYLDAMGDAAASEYWREIRRAIYRPTAEYIAELETETTTNRGEPS